MTALDPAFRVGVQITETLRAHQGLHRAEAEARAVSLLRAVGIPAAEERLRAYPHELSGGMRQRVALAIAISCNPDVLIADEPTGNLDKATGEAIFALFRHLVRSEGITIIVTTHNRNFGYEADRVITLEDGKIVKEVRGENLNSVDPIPPKMST
jgi:ABC-type glutathione transport system ATPase component